MLATPVGYRTAIGRLEGEYPSVGKSRVKEEREWDTFWSARFQCLWAHQLPALWIPLTHRSSAPPIAVNQQLRVIYVRIYPTHAAALPQHTRSSNKKNVPFPSIKIIQSRKEWIPINKHISMAMKGLVAAVRVLGLSWSRSLEWLWVFRRACDSSKAALG